MTRLKLSRRSISIVAALLLIGSVAPAAFAQCGASDIVFAMDTTGSMGGALDNVKAEMGKLIADITTLSSGDFRLGLVGFEPITVYDKLAPSNADKLKTDMASLVAGGGGNEPEDSDEALNTIINSLKESDRTGAQTGDFDTPFRSSAQKVIILVTDARPAGLDDDYTEGVDDVHAHAMAVAAAAKGIKISAIFVPTPFEISSGNDVTIRRVMQDYAATTGGLYIEANGDGTGTAEGILTVIHTCKGATFFLDVDPPAQLIAGDGRADFNLATTAVGEFTSDVTFSTSKLPDGATVTFDPPTVAAPGTGTTVMHFTPGVDTLPGDYFITVTATSQDAGTSSRTVKVTVDCRPPFIYGTPESQPQTQTVRLGQPATLHVVAEGTGPFRYQWYRSSPGSTFFPIDGATGATYVTPPASASATFWVRVSNPCGTYDSFPATVSPQGQGGTAVPEHRGHPILH